MEIRHWIREAQHLLQTANIYYTGKEDLTALRAINDMQLYIRLVTLALSERILERKPRKCRVCGCTDDDCSSCIAKTGHPCTWIEPDLCSACFEP